MSSLGVSRTRLMQPSLSMMARMSGLGQTMRSYTMRKFLERLGTSLITLGLPKEVSMERKGRFVENASEGTTRHGTANLDEQNNALAKNDPEYLTVIMSTAREFNDDPGSGATNHTDYGGLVAANDNLARKKLNFSSDIGSE